MGNFLFLKNKGECARLAQNPHYFGYVHDSIRQSALAKVVYY